MNIARILIKDTIHKVYFSKSPRDTYIMIRYHQRGVARVSIHDYSYDPSRIHKYKKWFSNTKYMGEPK